MLIVCGYMEMLVILSHLNLQPINTYHMPLLWFYIWPSIDPKAKATRAPPVSPDETRQLTD